MLAYGVALALLLSYATWGGKDGARLMIVLNFLQAGVAVAVAAALGPSVARLVALAVDGDLTRCACWAWRVSRRRPCRSSWTCWAGLALAASAGMVVVAATWLGSADLRGALAR